MPTTINRDAQLSTLANLAYSDNPPKTVGDWTRVLPSDASSSGFFAVAYINSTTKEVVVSYRGTDGLNGDIGADIAFKTGSWNPQFQEAAKFTAQVKELVASNSQYWDPETKKPGALLTTGHSLGGGIAQIMGKMFGADGASFDAPGASAIVGSAGFAAAQAQYASHSTGQIGAQFYNYVAQGSAISSVSTHLGQDQSLVNLSDPSAAPLLVGVIGAMTGGAGLALLGLGVTADLLSTHPMAGIERAMYISAGLDQALKDGSLSMSTVPISQATGTAWHGEGVEPRVVVFKNGDGQVKAYVQRDGDNWIAATPDQSTVIHLNKPTGSDAPVCTVQQEGKEGYSCTMSQSGKTVDISKDTNGDGAGDEISITETSDDLLTQTTRLTDADGDLLQTTRTDYTYSNNSADYSTDSTVTDADGNVTRSIHSDYSYNDLGEETRSDFVSDASGTTKTVYNDAGNVVSQSEIQSGASNIGYAVGAAASFLSLVKALEAGKPLPIAVAGVNTLAALQAGTGSVNASLAATQSVLGAATSLYNLSVAWKQGDGTGVLAAGTSSLYYGGTAYANMLGYSSVGAAAAEGAISAGAAEAIGAAGQAMPYVNLVNDLSHGNTTGVVLDVVCIAFPAAAPFVMVASMIFSMFDDPPTPWGNGNFAFNDDGTIRIQATGGDGGYEPVFNTLSAYKDTLANIVSQYNQAAPTAQIGLVANRMGSLSFNGGQWTLTTLNPDTGGQITLHYGSDGKVQDAAVGSPEYFRSMGEQYIYSALQSGAIAAGWEVQTAAKQSALGDPMAGLTEVQRAQRSNQYLGAQHITSVGANNGANGQLGTWRTIGLDLNGDGIQTVSEQTSGVVFDVDGTGFAKQTAWVGKQDGMLVLDRNFNGVIDSGSELFGNTQVALGAQGLKGLAWVDANVDGNIDSQDAVYSQLRVWQDANGNGLVDNSEAKSLTDLGISSIHYQRGSYDKNGQNLQISSVDLQVDSKKFAANEQKYRIAANGI